jgi:hypothetical protein
MCISFRNRKTCGCFDVVVVVLTVEQMIRRCLLPQLSEKNSFNGIFPDGWAILGSFMPHFKIPLNPPFPKGDDNGFSPLAKGS